MFLGLQHQKLAIYYLSKSLIIECYKLTRILPVEEKFNLTQQIRRAAVSVMLNISEGCSRKLAKERRRFFEVSRSSLVEIDAALDILIDLDYCRKEILEELGNTLLSCFKLLSKHISSLTIDY